MPILSRPASETHDEVRLLKLKYADDRHGYASELKSFVYTGLFASQ